MNKTIRIADKDTLDNVSENTNEIKSTLQNISEGGWEYQQ